MSPCVTRANTLIGREKEREKERVTANRTYNATASSSSRLPSSRGREMTLRSHGRSQYSRASLGVCFVARSSSPLPVVHHRFDRLFSHVGRPRTYAIHSVRESVPPDARDGRLSHSSTVVALLYRRTIHLSLSLSLPRANRRKQQQRRRHSVSLCRTRGRVSVCVSVCVTVCVVYMPTSSASSSSTTKRIVGISLLPSASPSLRLSQRLSFPPP